ncbi:hypothetical protein KUL118_45760 [Tenacibaculum sp. KUL118]|nr:hypothetical protein KUL118_45760 [Tenacibaculum sp. KUL118]
MSTINAMQTLLEKLYTAIRFVDASMCSPVYKGVMKTQKQVVFWTKRGAIVNTLNRMFGFERVYVGF